jgi:WD40 repeat protein
MGEDPDISISYEPHEYDFVLESEDTICFLLRRGRLPLTRMSIPGKRLTCLDVSPLQFGPLVAIGFHDGAVLVACDLCDTTRRYEKARFLLPHANAVTSVAFQQVSLALVSAAADGTLGLHRYDAGKWLTRRKVVGRVPATALCWRDDRLLIGTLDGMVSMWASVWEELSKVAEIKVHEGQVKLMLTLTNIPGTPIASSGSDRRLKFLKVGDRRLAIESELNPFPDVFDKIQYDSGRKLLRILCRGIPEETWKLGGDGKWRQTESVD